MSGTASVEERLGALERQVAELKQQALAQPAADDWRKTVGMFGDDPVMKAIQEEGKRIRDAEREQARRDHS